MPRATKSGSPRGISTEDWIRVAKTTLIEEGIAGVKIDRLAKKSGVTRGGFYYRFNSLQGLLDALIEDWRATNTKPILDALNGKGTPAERYRALIRLWLEERDYEPDYDTAVRAWAQVSPEVADAVHEVDAARIDALRNLFLDAGYDKDEAFIRARISYFHQVGYYAMGIRESTKRREELSPLYYRVLTGFRTGELMAASTDLDAKEATPAKAKPPVRKRAAAR